METGPLKAYCPVCGKFFVTMWREHWIYRRGDTYYCSWNCLDVDITKDLKLMHEVQRKRRERKMYNKLKKDDTPAKKSGPKPKSVESPEPVSGGEWEKMETPESNKLKVAVIGKPETAGELKREARYTVTAIKYPEIGEFYYDRKYNSIDWRTPEGDEVSMSPTAWNILQNDLKEIMTVLGVEL